MGTNQRCLWYWVWVKLESVLCGIRSHHLTSSMHHGMRGRWKTSLLQVHSSAYRSVWYIVYTPLTEWQIRQNTMITMLLMHTCQFIQNLCILIYDWNISHAYFQWIFLYFYLFRWISYKVWGLYLQCAWWPIWLLENDMWLLKRENASSWETVAK